MKILLAGMHYTPNQFTRGIHEFGCQWVHWQGSDPRREMPTNCDAVVIAKCQLSHKAFWQAKDTYLGMKKPIFVAGTSFTEIAVPFQEWLMRVGHLNELGVVKKVEKPKQENTIMSQAFQQAVVIPREPEIEKKEEPKVGYKHHKTIPAEQASQEWEKNLPVINEIMKTMSTHSGDDVAEFLNSKGIATKRGCAWSSATVIAYGLKTGVRIRQKNTAAGSAGSTGHYVLKSKPASISVTPPPPAPTASKASVAIREKGVTDAEIEEIMTSNLNTQLKMKVIRLLAVGDL